LAGRVALATGHAWLWARPEAFQSVDVLFIDEAGVEEHKLPPEYVESCIRAVHAIRDPVELFDDR
jgi:hypothetical protein